ncbi:MAG: hypothetical protein WCW14_04225 [Candidatus Paceibacterota bacterium]|jgi:hypothetical protein
MPDFVIGRRSSERGGAHFEGTFNTGNGMYEGQDGKSDYIYSKNGSPEAVIINGRRFEPTGNRHTDNRWIYKYAGPADEKVITKSKETEVRTNLKEAETSGKENLHTNGVSTVDYEEITGGHYDEFMVTHDNCVLRKGQSRCLRIQGAGVVIIGWLVDERLVLSEEKGTTGMVIMPRGRSIRIVGNGQNGNNVEIRMVDENIYQSLLNQFVVEASGGKAVESLPEDITEVDAHSPVKPGYEWIDDFMPNGVVLRGGTQYKLVTGPIQKEKGGKRFLYKRVDG